MWTMFLDDSKQNWKNINDDIWGLGGFRIENDNIKKLEEYIRAIKRKYDVPEYEEVKWSLPNGNWIKENLSGESRILFIHDILSLLEKFKVIILVAAVEGYNDKVRALRLCSEFLAERFQYVLQNENSRGFIIIDHFDDNYNKALQHSMADWLKNGTKYVKLDRITMNLIPVKSEMFGTIQLADLITGITIAMLAERTYYAKDHWKFILKYFDNGNGVINGFGLKLFGSNISINSTFIHEYLLG